jgi:hypothetical protein
MVTDAFTIYRVRFRVQAVTESNHGAPDQGGRPLKEQLEVAVRDLWTMLEESGEDFAIFMDRRRLRTRVQQDADGRFRVSWDDGGGQWIEYERRFENVREAAFHAYQGPHPA